MSLDDMLKFTPEEWTSRQAGLDSAINRDIGVIEAEQGTIQAVATLDRLGSETSKSLARGGVNVLSGLTSRAAEAAQLDPSPMIGLGAQAPRSLPKIQENELSSYLDRWSTALFNEAQSERLAPDPNAGRYEKFFTQTVPEILPYMAFTTMATLAVGPTGGFLVGSAVEGHNHYRTAKADMLKKGFSEEDAERIARGEAEIVGFVSGMIETSQVSGVINFAKKPAAQAFKKLVAARTLKRIGSSIGSLTLAEAQLFAQEAVEEGLQSATSQGIARINHNGEWSWTELGESMLQGGTAGLFLGTVGGVAGAALQSEQAPESGTQILSEEEIQQQEEVFQQEVQDAENARIDKAVEKQAKKAITPIEKTDTPDGKPPLETKTPITVNDEATVVSNEVDGNPPLTDVFSPRQDVVEEHILSLENEIPSKTSQSFAQWQQEAIDLGYNKEGEATRISDVVLNTNRAMTEQESAGVTLAIKDLYHERMTLEAKLDTLGDKPDTELWGNSLERFNATQFHMEEAMYISGSTRGRNLVSQRYALDLEGSIIKLKSRARRAKAAPLTVEENKAVETQFEDLQSKVKELEAQLAKERAVSAEQVFKETKKAVKKTKKKGKKAVAESESTLTTKINEVNRMFEEGCAV